LIVVDEGAEVHYIEGCTAPIYSTASLHAAVVEIFCKPGSNVRYTTVQNWSKDVYNLVTKRAQVEEDARMSWVDGNLGSKVTMKYPAVLLTGKRAHGEVLSIAFAGDGQHQDAGARAIHLAPDTTSLITSRSISKGAGRTSYRGTLRVKPEAKHAKAHVRCDALLLDPASRSDTYPKMDVQEKQVTIEHEASVSKIGEEQLFFLQARGFSEEEAKAMIVNGFIRPIVKELPFEYAIELNRLIALEMEGSIG
jgi:Fe-S cluster assembly protein SufB